MRERIYAIKHLIMLYYLVMAIVFGSFIYFVPMDASMDQTITIILCLFLLLFPIVMLYTLNYALHVFLFTLAFIAGFYGFYHHSVENHSISNALYFTFRLYLLDLADVFTQDGSSPIRYPLLLEIARWTAASYTISTIFIAMYRTLEKEIALFIAQTFGNHHIIFSYNEKSHALIHDLRRRKERVIVVDDQFSSETQNMLEEMKVIVIQAPIKGETIFQTCGVKKAKSIALFHPNDRESLYVLMHLDQYIRQKKLNVRLKKVIIQIENERYQAELTSFLDKVEHFAFPVHMVNVYEEVAKHFWHLHQAILTSKEPLHLLIVGYGLLGKQMAEAAQKRASSLPLQITIVDDFPSYEHLGRVEKIPFNVATDSLEALITEKKDMVTHIFICLDEDYVDLMEGIELSEIFPTTPIYMNFTDESIEQTFMIATTKTKKSLYSIGTKQEVLTKEYLDI